MRIPCSALIIVVCLARYAEAQAPNQTSDVNASGCVACHRGIEPIRETDSAMMKYILAHGRGMGDPAGCIVCHGGDATAKTKDQAHKKTAFYPDPSSPWINEATCGPCHSRHVRTQWTCLMMTESGKMQGTAWGFGALEGYTHVWGNYDVRNPADPELRVGSSAYRAYMQRLKALEPGAYPDAQTTLPEAPTDLATLLKQPGQAAFTYQRAECQRCHLAVRGRQGVRGDYRGMGCSACHIPYSDAGLYEGNDPTIPKDKPGHMLVHSIQSTRKTKVTVGEITYSGIPLKTCETCHNRGKRIGVSFQGLMEGAFTSPSTEGGGEQITLHGKRYIAMHKDIHAKKGMLCQDCHTSIDVHGDGFIAGTNLAQVEIECNDCHGTPRAYPWELPLGYADEFGPTPQTGEPRGVATELRDDLGTGTVYPVEDGYLLTARGNPIPEATRRGNRVIVHTAGGKDIELEPLKLLVSAKPPKLGTEARVGMLQVAKHIDRMECYACHATWVPQCYGCHLTIDYSRGKKAFDWVAAGHRHAQPEHRAENVETGYDTMLPGQSTEQRSYLRWEEPPLAVGGEWRICPVTTGCQTTVTIIGQDGKTVLLNHIFRTPPNTAGGGPEGQLALDMSPGQPHTTGHARACESCHMSPKAVGYGIESGRLSGPWNKPVFADLATADGRVLAKHSEAQIQPIPNLGADWSRFVTEDGKQLQTVGHHWTKSRPLNNQERANMDRQRVCLACHQEIPDQSLAVSLLHHIAERADALPKTNEQHAGLIHQNLLLAAWIEVAAPVLAISAALVGCGWLLNRHRKRRSRLHGENTKQSSEQSTNE